LPRKFVARSRGFHIAFGRGCRRFPIARKTVTASWPAGRTIGWAGPDHPCANPGFSTDVLSPDARTKQLFPGEPWKETYVRGNSEFFEQPLRAFNLRAHALRLRRWNNGYERLIRVPWIGRRIVPAHLRLPFDRYVLKRISPHEVERLRLWFLTTLSGNPVAGHGPISLDLRPGRRGARTPRRPLNSAPQLHHPARLRADNLVDVISPPLQRSGHLRNGKRCFAPILRRAA
jgi:hypothetical protein